MKAWLFASRARFRTVVLVVSLAVLGLFGLAGAQIRKDLDSSNLNNGLASSDATDAGSQRLAPGSCEAAAKRFATILHAKQYGVATWRRELTPTLGAELEQLVFTLKPDLYKNATVDSVEATAQEGACDATITMIETKTQKREAFTAELTNLVGLGWRVTAWEVIPAKPVTS